MWTCSFCDNEALYREVKNGKVIFRCQGHKDEQLEFGDKHAKDEKRKQDRDKPRAI